MDTLTTTEELSEELRVTQERLEAALSDNEKLNDKLHSALAEQQAKEPDLNTYLCKLQDKEEEIETLKSTVREIKADYDKAIAAHHQDTQIYDEARRKREKKLAILMDKNAELQRAYAFRGELLNEAECEIRYLKRVLDERLQEIKRLKKRLKHADSQILKKGSARADYIEMQIVPQQKEGEYPTAQARGRCLVKAKEEIIQEQADQLKLKSGIVKVQKERIKELTTELEGRPGCEKESTICNLKELITRIKRDALREKERLQQTLNVQEKHIDFLLSEREKLKEVLSA